MAYPPNPPFAVSANVNRHRFQIHAAVPVARECSLGKINSGVKFIFLLTALTAQHCLAGTEKESSGTIIAFVASKESVAFAADSRIHFTDGSGLHHDDGCKISTPQHKFVFAWAGAAEWAREEAIILAQKPITNRADLPKQWAYQMALHLQGWTKSQMVDFARDIGNPRISTGIFAVAGPMGVELHRASLMYRDTGETTFSIAIVIDSPPAADTPEIMGFSDAFLEIVNGATTRGNRDRTDIESHRGKPDFQVFSVMRIVQRTLEWNPQSIRVGGPIDAVRLLRNGTIQWIQRKQNCPAQ